MVTARAFLSLLAGFAVMVTIVLVVTALLRRIAPEWVEPQHATTPSHVFVNLGYSFLAGAGGGYMTAWAAGLSPVPDVLGLAIIVLVLAAISALQGRRQQPVWYQMMLAVIAPLGVIAGGLVRLRVVGIL